MIHQSINQSIHLSFICRLFFIYIVSFLTFCSLTSSLSLLSPSLFLDTSTIVTLFFTSCRVTLSFYICHWYRLIVSTCQLTDFQMKWRKYFTLCLNVAFYLLFFFLSFCLLLLLSHLRSPTDTFTSLHESLIASESMVTLCLSFTCLLSLSPFLPAWICCTQLLLYLANSYASRDQLKCLHVTSDHETSFSKILLDRWTDSRDIATFSK